MPQPKRTKLQDAFASDETQSEPTTKHETKSAGRVVAKQKSRDGQKSVSFWTSPEAAHQLKMLAVENNTTINALLRKAVNELFITYKKADIA